MQDLHRTPPQPRSLVGRPEEEYLGSYSGFNHVIPESMHDSYTKELLNFHARYSFVGIFFFLGIWMYAIMIFSTTSLKEDQQNRSLNLCGKEAQKWVLV